MHTVPTRLRSFRVHALSMLHLTVFSPLLDVESTTVDFDPDDGIDTLLYQFVSVCSSDTDLDIAQLLLLDRHGREITTGDDILEVKFKQPVEVDGSGGEGVVSAELWCIAKSSVDPSKFCTACLPELPPRGTPGYANDVEGLIQPCYSLMGTPYNICACCTKYFDADLIEQTTRLQTFRCDIKQLVDVGIAAPSAKDHLPEGVKELTLVSGTVPYPVVLYIKRVLLDRALKQLRNHSQKGAPSREQQQFGSRIESTARAVLVYEDPRQQEVARRHIDFDKVRAYAEEHLAAILPPLDGDTTNQQPAEAGDLTAERRILEDKALLVALMRWFKLDFFKWCNKPACDNAACRAPPGRMDGVGMVEPSAEEKSVGECSMCGW
jgi:hypothetical protein